jgi:hypothetical protein
VLGIERKAWHVAGSCLYRHDGAAVPIEKFFLRGSFMLFSGVLFLALPPVFDKSLVVLLAGLGVYGI